MIEENKDKASDEEISNIEAAINALKEDLENGAVSESRYSSYIDLLSDQNIYRKSDESSNSKS